MIDKYNVTCPHTGHSIKVTQVCDGKKDCTGAAIALDEYQCQEKGKDEGKLKTPHSIPNPNSVT